MKRKNELSYKELKMTCNPTVFNFDTTEELDPIIEGIGQERGIPGCFKAIQNALKL